MKKTKSRKRLILLLILAALLLVAAVGAWVFLSGSYHADRAAVAALHDTSRDIEIRAGEDRIDFVPREAQAGLIFYPGGKVEFGAYAPLMKACAERGILCVLLHVPGDLAVLDHNAADGVAADYPDIDRWYVGGHSLGANIAATYAKRHADDLAGLVMLAGYATDDLTDTGLQVLSVYGTEDGVLNRGRYETYRSNLPADTVEVVIEGGCHSYFGSYGLQSGDGTPKITNAQQIAQTADAIQHLLASKAQSDAA